MRSLPFALAAAAVFGWAGPSAAETFADVATVTAQVEPPRVSPGQLVTLKLSVEPKKGAYTYPAEKYSDKKAEKCAIGFGLRGDLILVGDLKNPAGAVPKNPDNGDFDEVYKKTVIWEVKAVVSPDAKPGKHVVPLSDTRFQVCTSFPRENCYNSAEPRAEFEVATGPALPIAEPYLSEVNKALAEKPAPAVPPQSPPQTRVGGAPDAPPTPAGFRLKDPATAGQYAAELDDLSRRIEAAPTPPAGEGGTMHLLAAAVVWGLVSLVTPCVFPMIPITVSLFLKQSHQSPAQVLKLAAVYCLTIIAVLGLSAILLLSVFRKLSVDPAMNLFLGGLFVVFALSLFGMYDITLPGFLLRSAEKRRGAGGMVGTVFGALAFSIVSFTCVAPFLGGFAGLAASGNFAQWELVLAGLTFATAFASPFFVLALFPSLIKKLPKSGGWLDTVKAVMGFLELAAAFKFFRTAELRLLDHTEYFTYDLVLAAWVAVAAAAGLYLLNVYRLPHDEPMPNVGVTRMLIGVTFLGLGLYLFPALVKPQRPGGAVFAWVDAFLLPEPGPAGEGELAWGTDLRAAIDRVVAEKRAKGAAANPLILVDFTGVTCTNCKLNEKDVFPQPKVRELLSRYTLVQMYTDEVPAAFYTNPPARADRKAEGQANLAFQLGKFGTEQLPLYVILEPLTTGGVRVVGMYDEGKINDVPAFVAFLKGPLGEK